MDVGFALGLLVGNLFAWGLFLPIVLYKRKPKWIDLFLGFCVGLMAIMIVTWFMSLDGNVPEAWEQFF